MDLIFDPSGRPDDLLATDGMVLNAGERFSVPDERGRSLLAQLYPSVREAPAPPQKPAKRPQTAFTGNNATNLKLGRA